MKIDKRRFLKIKLKSLAAETRIIRDEERWLRDKARKLKQKGRLGADIQKVIDDQREATYRHRIDVVRWEARHTHLAYGFLRRLSFDSIERSGKPIDWQRIETMIRKYGTAEAISHFEKAQTKEAA